MRAATTNSAASLLKYTEIYPHKTNVVSGKLFAPGCISVNLV